MTDPRHRPRKGGRKEAYREQDYLDLGQKEAEEEKAELGGEKDDELEPLTRTTAAAWLSF